MTLLTARPMQEAQPRRAHPCGEQLFFLSDVSWESYRAIGAALTNRPGLRITYDRGNLEFMTTSREHGFFKTWLSRFVQTIAEELNRPIAPGGNMTLEREDLRRALEGDECFWIEHEPHMRRKLTWDPEIDPPPDLALEIEVSRSVLNRLEIYAALRVPEVWSFNGTRIQVRLLQPDGTYQLSDKSRFFPEIPVAQIAAFFAPDQTTDFLTAVKEFRAWVRQVLGMNT